MRMRTPVITLSVLVALAVGADLAAEQVAENIAAEKVDERMPGHQGSVDVDIRGFPFLTQAVSGRFDEIDITVKDTTDPTGSTSTLTLPKATLTAHDVHVENTSSAVADLIDGQVTVPYDAIAQGLQSQHPGHGEFEIAPVTGGTNRVRITQGDHHVIARLTGQGTHVVFTPETEGAAEQMLTLSPGPLETDITGVTLHDDGVHVHVAAQLVTLG